MMASTKHRSKTDKPASSDTSTAESEQQETKQEALTLEEQLDRAEAAVFKARDATVFLHEQWRTHLFRISFLVLILSFYQCQQPMKECMANIKLANKMAMGADEQNTIDGYQAFFLIIRDAFCEICGNCMLFALSAFLAMKPAGAFSSPLYMIATLLLPLQLTSYFSVREIGCPYVLQQLKDEVAAKEVKVREFPVTLVFHAIVTACYFFMESQLAGRERDVRAVLKLRNDLANTQAQGKGKTPKATSGRANKKSQ